MRRTLSFAATLVIGTLLLAGCSDDTTSGNDTDKGSMSARVNGTSWSASQITQATYTGGVLGLGGTTIEGSVSRTMQIGGLVSGTGDYAIGGITGLQASYSDGSLSSTTTFIATSGTLKVESISSTGAKGTFSFEALEQSQAGPGTETRSITEGTFDVKF